MIKDKKQMGYMLDEIDAEMLKRNLAEDVIYAKDHPKVEESKPE